MSHNYTIPFKSLAGKTCRIDISDGSNTSPITLSVDDPTSPGFPAAVPCSWTDDNSDDLLSVVRSKTGYINLVERTYGSLSDLFPDYDMQYTVTVVYDTTGDNLTIFRGFIQAQSFENQWEYGPRELSLPITSPLGLLPGKKFYYIHPPRMITLGEALQEVMGQYGYTHVVLPRNFGLLASEINSLVISPWSKKEVIVTDADMFEPLTYQEFIEAFCNCNGMIAYDMPGILVFARYDLTSDYVLYPYSEMANPNPAGTTITSYASLSGLTLCDDQSIEGLVRPLSRIQVNYDGEYKDSVGYGFDMALAAQNGPTYWATPLAYTMKLIINQGTFEPNHAWASISLDADGLPTTKGVGLWAVGSSIDMNAGIMVYFDAAAWADTRLFTVKFFQPPHNPSRVDISMLWGDNVKKLGEDMEQAGFDELFFDLVISCRGYYYNGSSQSWTTSSYKNKITIGKDGKGSLNLWYVTGPQYGPIVVDVYQRGSEMPNKLFMFTDITLNKFSLPYNKYTPSDELTQQTIDLNNQSREEGSVSRLFAFETDNTNTIFTTQYSSIWNVPFYPYLGASMRKLEFNAIGILDDNPYLCQYTFNGFSGKVIATGCVPSDDQTSVLLMG